MRKNGRSLLLTGLFWGWAADWLFYDKAAGLSVPLFLLLVLTGIAWRGRREGITAVKQNLWLWIPTLFFGSMIAIQANAFLTTLNLLAVTGLMSAIIFYTAKDRVVEMTMESAALLPLRVGIGGMLTAVPLVRQQVDLENMQKHSRRELVPILRGGLFAIPLLFVFTALLASADLMFANFLENLLAIEILRQLPLWLWRALLILLWGGWSAGLLAYLIDRQQAETAPRAMGRLRRGGFLGFIETSTMLLLVNGLFLVFTAVQFAYLFGGAQLVETAGYSYAEYARRGFFELLTVAMLTLLLIIGLNWLADRQTKRQLRLFNLLSSGLVAFVLVMLVSAFQRMRLYEMQFGYTHLRLYVFVFIFWLGALLLWLLVCLWRQPDRLAIGMLVTAVGFLVTMNLLNPDAFIAQRNWVHYQRTGQIDAAHLTTLSVDALPELLRLKTAVSGDNQQLPVPWCPRGWLEERIATDCFDTPEAILEMHINTLTESLTQADSQPWQSFNLARWRAKQLLVAESNPP